MDTRQSGLWEEPEPEPVARIYRPALLCLQCPDRVASERLAGFGRCKVASVAWVFLGESARCNLGRLGDA